MNAALHRSRRPLALSVVVAAGIYLAAILLSDGPAVLERVRALPSWLPVALLALPALGFAVRFVRWDLYLRRLGHTLPRPLHARIYMAGFALTTTPGKVGENLRAVYLLEHDVPVAHSVGAFVAERLGDLVAMIILAGLAFEMLGAYGGAMATTILLTVVGVIVLRDPRLPDALVARGQGDGVVRRALAGVGRGLGAARDLLGLRLLAVGVLIALVAWGAEAYTFALAARHVGVDIPVTGAMGVFAVGTLLGAVSLFPGGVGPTEAVLGGLLVLAGGSVAEATAATVLVRAATLWWAVLLGIVALVGLRTPAADPELQGVGT